LYLGSTAIVLRNGAKKRMVVVAKKPVWHTSLIGNQENPTKRK
jgi:hypothetical protein